MNSRILPALALMVAVAMFFIYVSPTWSGSIAATKAAIAADNEALAAAATYIAQQKELSDARDAIAPTDLERLETFLPDSVDNVGLILDLNALAARSGLALSNIDVTANTATANSSTGDTGLVNSIDLSLSAMGTYSALKTFLDGVEKSVRLLDTQDLTIAGSDTGVYTYHMKLRIHWLR